jgi:hypothetical protein
MIIEKVDNESGGKEGGRGGRDLKPLSPLSVWVLSMSSTNQRPTTRPPRTQHVHVASFFECLN